MKAFWGSSYGFPGALPTGPFKDYIRRNEIDASHYYSAYPDATMTMVLAALRARRAGSSSSSGSATWMSPTRVRRGLARVPDRRAAVAMSERTSGQACTRSRC